ncbi:MAG: hypothetical protein GY737_18975 [Desulfobacteraceae bacterium]|nr:hypothetical protein [Desulfobacteraceae bacterium]
MKKHIAWIITFLLVLAVPTVIPATDHTKTGHGMVEEGEKAVRDAMDHGKMGHDMPGKAGVGRNRIREAHVKGHHFAYELIDMREKIKDMPGMKNTHHLMVYIKDEQGNTLGKAKVGYLIKGPGGKTQKVMCMGMGGGYGADVNLGETGAYLIKTKVVAGKTKLMDSFEYEMKQPRR